jgi:hypothetical protein
VGDPAEGRGDAESAASRPRARRAFACHAARGSPTTRPAGAVRAGRATRWWSRWSPSIVTRYPRGRAWRRWWWISQSGQSPDLRPQEGRRQARHARHQRSRLPLAEASELVLALRRHERRAATKTWHGAAHGGGDASALSADEGPGRSWQACRAMAAAIDRGPALRAAALFREEERMLWAAANLHRVRDRAC